MTKQEKIQEAYGEYFEKMKPWIDEKGWFNKNAFYEEKFFFKYDDLNTAFHHKEDFMIPITIKELDSNKGWVKINNEDDFPKESIYMETINKSYDIKDPKSQGMHHFIKGDEKFLMGLISHYRILPFDPPIY